jgi:hypothetical protein
MTIGKEASVESISKRFSLSESQIDKFLRGEVVTKDLDATSDKDLSLLIVLVVDADLDTCWEFVHAEKVAEIQSATMSSGPIPLSSLDGSSSSNGHQDEDDSTLLQDMVLEDEALQKLEANPGGLYSMSKAEAQIMKDKKKTHHPNAMVALRHILMGRARAYWEKGIAGIVPYEGGKGRDPRVDLEHATKYAMKILENTWIHQQVLASPSQAVQKNNDDDDGEATINHSLSWSIQKGRDLAAPTLDHRIRCKSEVGMALIVRRFYSGYDYDAMQIVTGVLPTADPGKSVVFHTNHTYTSKVAGFGGSAKRAIGRKMMVGKMVETMQNIQAELRK